ncbi:hypothetical protein Tco_1530410 [Tanacetum coccineum]
METMAENVIAAGFENVPLMLKKGMFKRWKTRIILYIRGKENGEMLKDSIDNGPFQLKLEITIKDTNVVTDILDIYTLINHYQTAKEIWDHVKELITQATIQNGQVTVQNVQGRQSQCYANSAGKNQATGARLVNTVRNAGENQPRMEESDDCEELQLQATTNFKADHVDAYDSDCDDEATANAIFMASLSPVGSINGDMVEPCYDFDILFKVPHYNTYHETNVLNPNV